MTDIGANAKYIRKLFGEVSAALEKGEKTAEEKTMAETVEEMIQKALRDRWR